MFLLLPPVIRRLLLSKTSIHRFYKLRTRSINSVIVQCGPRGFNLIKRLAALDEVLNPIADNRDHVSIGSDVTVIGESAVARNNHRATLSPELRYSDLEYFVQSID